VMYSAWNKPVVNVLCALAPLFKITAVSESVLLRILKQSIVHVTFSYTVRSLDEKTAF
jgi:hypothetical protein